MTTTNNIELFKFTKNQQVGQIGSQNPSKQTQAAQKTGSSTDVPNALATGDVTGENNVQEQGATQNQDTVLNDDHEYLSDLGVSFSSGNSDIAAFTNVGFGMSGMDNDFLATQITNAENLAMSTQAYSQAKLNEDLSSAAAAGAASANKKSDSTTSSGSSSKAGNDKKGVLAQVGESLLNKTIDTGTSAIVNTGMSMIGLGSNSGTTSSHTVASAPSTTSISSTSSYNIPTKIKTGLFSSKTAEGNAAKDAENKLTNAQSALGKAQDELKSLEDKVTTANRELQEVQNDKKNTAVPEKITQINKKIQEQEVEKNKLQEKRGQHIDAQTQFNNEAKEKNKIADGQEKKATDCQNEAAKLGSQITDLENSISGLETQLNSTTDNSKRASLREQISSKKAELRQLRSQKEAKEKEAAEYKKQAEDNRKQAQIAQKRADEEGTKADGLNNEIKTTTERITVLQNDLKNAEQGLSEGQKATEQKIQAAQAKLTEATKERDAKQAEVDKLTADVQTYQSMYEAAAEEAEKTEEKENEEE